MRVKDLGTPGLSSMRSASSSRGWSRGHVPSIFIQRREIPYWQERGWTREGNHHTGSYQTPDAAFQGRIDEQRFSHATFYLYSPSPQIRSHSHFTCLPYSGTTGICSTWRGGRALMAAVP
jgi:hypothetical protein